MTSTLWPSPPPSPRAPTPQPQCPEWRAAPHRALRRSSPRDLRTAACSSPASPLLSCPLTYLPRPPRHAAQHAETLGSTLGRRSRHEAHSPVRGRARTTQQHHEKPGHRTRLAYQKSERRQIREAEPTRRARRASATPVGYASPLLANAGLAQQLQRSPIVPTSRAQSSRRGSNPQPKTRGGVKLPRPHSKASRYSPTRCPTGCAGTTRCAGPTRCSGRSGPSRRADSVLRPPPPAARV